MSSGSCSSMVSCDRLSSSDSMDAWLRSCDESNVLLGDRACCKIFGLTDVTFSSALKNLLIQLVSSMIQSVFPRECDGD